MAACAQPRLQAAAAPVRNSSSSFCAAPRLLQQQEPRLLLPLRRRSGCCPTYLVGLLLPAAAAAAAPSVAAGDAQTRNFYDVILYDPMLPADDALPWHTASTLSLTLEGLTCVLLDTPCRAPAFEARVVACELSPGRPLMWCTWLRAVLWRVVDAGRRAAARAGHGSVGDDVVASALVGSYLEDFALRRAASALGAWLGSAGSRAPGPFIQTNTTQRFLKPTGHEDPGAPRPPFLRCLPPHDMTLPLRAAKPHTPTYASGASWQLAR